MAINRTRAINSIHQVLHHNRIPQVNLDYRKGYETAIRLAETAVLRVPSLPDKSMFRWTPVIEALPEDVLPYNKYALTPMIECLITTGGFRKVKAVRRVARRRGYGFRKFTTRDPIMFWEWVINDNQQVIAWCIPEPYDGPAE